MNILKYFLMILIPPVLILGNFRALVFNFAFYQKLYEEAGVYNSFSEITVNNATNNLFGFFRGKNELDHNFYSEQARLHLKDVKELIMFSNNFFALTFIIVLVSSAVLFARNRRFFLKALFFSSAFTLVAILALVLGLFRFFDLFFLKFHQVLFDNQNWLFTKNDNLIKLFPPQFFVAFANRLAQNIIIASFVILLISAIFLRKARK